MQTLTSCKHPGKYTSKPTTNKNQKYNNTTLSSHSHQCFIITSKYCYFVYLYYFSFVLTITAKRFSIKRMMLKRTKTHIHADKLILVPPHTAKNENKNVNNIYRLG